MATQETSETKVRRLIEQLVEEHWANQRTVCYLSSIGVRLTQALPESREVLTGGLREFIRQHPVVRVVQFPGVAEKVGAVPLSVPEPEDVRELFTSNRTASGLQNRNVYMNEFWEAFIRSTGGHSRYVAIDDTGSVSVCEEPPEDDTIQVYEIGEEDWTKGVHGGTIAEKVDATHSAIDAWLMKHSLDYGTFLQPRGGRRKTSHERGLEGLLSAFDGLSSEDLARINIPLDIVLKLIAKR